MTYFGEGRILNVAARQHLGKRMAHQFGDALLALGGSGSLFETFGHWYPPGLDRICARHFGASKTEPETHKRGRLNQNSGAVLVRHCHHVWIPGSACADPE